MANYTFKVPSNSLSLAGELIEETRSYIPISFQGSWDNLIEKKDGARAIDYLDFLLYVVPTLIVPLFSRVEVRKALLDLVRGCSIALQWGLTEALIVEMEKCFKRWHKFLDENPRCAVISLNDVKHQVGLVKSAKNSLDYKVVAPYYIFRENVRITGGQLRNI